MKVSARRRFLNHVPKRPEESPEDHWLFLPPGFDGYGQLRVDGQTVSAHRFAYELWVGEIPEGFCVLHKPPCVTRNCCRPSHLYLGTYGDNNADRADAGRTILNVGRLNGNAALSDNDVVQILLALKNGELCPSVAKRYGVNSSTIRAIKNFQTWRHVKRP